MFRLLFVFFIFFVGIIGCKKDKLEGEMEQLIGEWDWINGTYETGFFKSPITEGYSYTLNFAKKGKYNIDNTDDDKDEKGRLLISELDGSNDAEFRIELKKTFVSDMCGRKLDVFFIGTDTLMLKDNCETTRTDLYVRK